jgi:hypothetical protein
MHPILRAGTVLMQTGTVMPESVWVEEGSYSPGWEVIKNLDGVAWIGTFARATGISFSLPAAFTLSRGALETGSLPDARRSEH